MHRMCYGFIEMASKQTYPCFACRKSGFEVQVFLDGKDDQGKTKYLNEDGTRHQHKQPPVEPIITKGSQVRSTLTEKNEVKPDLTSQTAEILSWIQALDSKIEHLTKLIYTHLQQQQQGGFAPRNV